MNLNLSDEKSMVKIILVFSVFTLIVISGTIGAVFMAFGLIYSLFLYQERNSVYEFSRGYYKWLSVIGVGAISLFAFLAFNGFLLSVINQTQFNLFSSIPTFSSQPAIVNITNPIVRLIVWGIMIPILESLFFIGFIGKQLVNRFKISGIQWKNPAFWIVIAMVGATATWFHLAADVTTESALLTDFIFFAFSMSLAIKLNELKQVTVLHVGINSLGVLKDLGWFALRLI